MWMEQSSLQGVDPVPAREARQQGIITGEQRVWLETGWKRTTLYRENKYQGEALKRKERYGWGLISKSGSYTRANESVKAHAEDQLHCTELRSRWQLRMEVTSIFLPADVLHENALWCFEFYFMVDGKLKIVSRELNGDLLSFEATWQRTVGQQREHPPL